MTHKKLLLHSLTFVKFFAITFAIATAYLVFDQQGFEVVKMKVETNIIENSLIEGKAEKIPDVENSLLSSLFESKLKPKGEIETNDYNSLFLPLDSDSKDDLKVKAYCRTFWKVARAEMEKFNIPASISLAQGIVESKSGESRLARENNNHFGIKCFSKKCTKGHCSVYNDDHHKDFFRKYKSNWRSWRAHSLLLVNSRYKILQGCNKDYKCWSEGLKRLGYATDKNYAAKLQKVIIKFQLHKLDR